MDSDLDTFFTAVSLSYERGSNTKILFYKIFTCSKLQQIEAETKRPPIHWQKIQMHFFNESYQHYFIIASDGLEPNRWQAIIWTSKG